jgi:TonB family protein
MPSVDSLVASFLINSLWQIPLVAAAGWLAARLLRRLGPQAEHIAWVSALAAALLTPLSPLIGHALGLLLPSRGAGPYVFPALSVAAGASPGAHGALLLPSSALWLVFALYLGSLFYFILRLSRGWLFAARLLRQAAPVPLTPEQEQQWCRCRQWFHLRKAQLLCSASISGPVALGLRKPVLVLREGFAADCAPQDFLAALAHECAHLQRNDFRKNLLYEIASLIIDFHPAAWLIKSRIAQSREMICDAMVTRLLVEPRSYAQSLLRLAAMVALAPRVSATPAIGIFDAGILEERIMRVNTKKQPAGRAWKYGLIPPATLFLFFAVAAGVSLALDVAPSSVAERQSSPYGQVYKIGNGVTAPVPLNAVEAQFPASGKSLKMGFNAIVLVGMIVDGNGMPQNVHIQRSYNAAFDAEAIKAAEQYRFKPAMRSGEPVAVSISVEVQFRKY